MVWSFSCKLQYPSKIYILKTCDLKIVSKLVSFYWESFYKKDIENLYVSANIAELILYNSFVILLSYKELLEFK